VVVEEVVLARAREREREKGAETDIMLLSLYIVNKSGGLIYHRDFSSLVKLDTNDTLRLGSIWHSLHAISSQLSPVPGCKGIELLEAETFDLHNFQTPTGIKFFAVAQCKSPGVDRFLRRVYNLYADYVLKNPFYELDMPIRCELFDVHLSNEVNSTMKG